MLSKPVRRWMVWCVSMAACAAASAAASVTELSVAELAAFVTRHEYVVVQMTSPDARCTYCIGADKIFDQASALSLDVPMAFARVQWSPWSKMPDLRPLVDVQGVPTHYVFRHGKLIGEVMGKQDHPQALISRIQAIVHKPVAAPAAGSEEPRRGPPPSPPAPPWVAMTDGERLVARVMARHDLLRGLMAACTKLFPDQAPVHQQAMEVGRREARSASTIRSG
ncbi:thioredoxin family protein [Rhodoferax sp.]|uniref:thioredoxin family protein n=1 Tax=Rhodoferax sp. TaxID=50421 RepID=UPI002776F49A|nr:thioredoxin family protein [Rhodoferax sp.]